MRATPLAAGLLAAALAMGCAALRGAPPVSPEEQSAFDAAIALAADDPNAAERRLEAFLEAWPASALADDVELRLGELAAARRDFDRALDHYYAAVRAESDGALADVARVRAAELEARRGNGETAARLVGEVRLSRLPLAERRTAYRVLASVAPDPVAKVRWLAQLRSTESDEHATALLDVEIDDVLQGLERIELDRLADQLGDREPAARVQLAAAARALDEGDLEAARAHLARAARLSLADPYASRLAGLEERMRLAELGEPDASELPTLRAIADRAPPPTSPVRATLGVALPLSGRFAPFGEESLRGVLLAAGIFGAADGDGREVRLLVRDTGGRPELAAEAVRELSRRELVSAIIGPLAKAECEAAASAATAEDVPLIALTSRAEIATGRPPVFRVRTMAVEEIEVLVHHALLDLGARRFAILYPGDAFGRGLRALFWDAVEAGGGEITGVAAYDPAATDFAEPIRQLLGFGFLDDEERRLIARRDDLLKRARRAPLEAAALLREEADALTTADGHPLPPIVDFDALFVADSHEKAVLIAPQLAFHEAEHVRLLGPSAWDDARLVEIGERYVEGARFTAHFHAASDVPVVHAFTEAYERTYALPPGEFAAEAFDATNLVLAQLARGLEGGPAIRQGVLSVREFPGVTGVLSMRPDGNAHKRPILLGVERGRIVEIE